VKTDYDKFKEFFDRMGVLYHSPDHIGIDRRHGEEPKESIYNLVVSQAIFCFDIDKNYIGMVSDEMGIFEGRLKS